MKMNNLKNTVNKTSELFRIGAEGEGSRGVLEILNAITSVLGGNSVQETIIEKEDLVLLNTIAAAQQRGDFLHVADLLEYELPRSALWKIIATRLD